MGWPIVNIGSWNQFAELADRFILMGEPSEIAYLFRGQSDAIWDNLKPSLTRTLEGSSIQDVHGTEQHAWMTFRKQAHRYINLATIADWEDPLEWWPWMQHYGAPTRLLDWTGSPYVAAYFAVVQNWKSDGVVWFFHGGSLHQAMEVKYPIEGLFGPNTRLNAKSLVSDPEAPARVVHFYQVFDDHRMFAQQGSFTICLQPLADHARVIEEAIGAIPNALGTIVIRKALKPEFLRRLRAMNIGANSLFPGVDGIDQSIAELVRLGRAPRPSDPYELIHLSKSDLPYGVEVRFLDRPSEDDPCAIAGWVCSEPRQGTEPTPDTAEGGRDESPRE